MKLQIATATALLLPLSAPAQDADKKDPPAAGDLQAEMVEYMKLIEPGPMHKELAKAVGSWDMVQTFVIPGAPQMVAKGTMVTRAVHGGRYFISEVESRSVMGEFEGTSTAAYDTFNKRFVNTWIDSMGTGILVSYGKLKDDGSIEYLSEPQPDPMAGGKVVFRMVSKVVNDDKMIFDMWSKAVGDTEETKMMNVVYTRKKEG